MRFDGSAWVFVGSQAFSAGQVAYVSLTFNPSTAEPYVAFGMYDYDINANRANVMKFDGSSWGNVGSADFSPGGADFTSLAFNPLTNEPYVAYEDWTNSFKATVMKFDGSSWENVGSPGLSAGVVNYINIAFNPSTHEPYVAYEDTANSQKATVMKFDGSQWTAVGSQGFTTICGL
jgi:hypothetical protein